MGDLRRFAIYSINYGNVEECHPKGLRRAEKCLILEEI